MATDRFLLKEYETKAQRIQESTSRNLDANESPEQAQRRIARALANYEVFATTYFHTYVAGTTLPKFQKDFAARLHKHQNTIELLQWSREFGKSVHATAIGPLWLYFNGRLTGLITGSANENLAMRLLFDIKANLEYNARLIQDFGDRRSIGTWAMDGFTTTDGVQFLPFGVDQSPRGVRFGANRPNYGVVDDLNDKKTLKNDTISQEIYEWVKEDFMGALSAKGWWLVVPQNKFHRNTVTAKFEHDPELKPKVHLHRVNMVNAAGESNFPEHITTAQALDKIKSLGYYSSQREYFNNPIEEGKIFKREAMLFAKRLPWKQYDVLIAYSDPSYKNTAKSDYKATVLLGKKGPRYTVLRARIDKVSIDQMFRWHYAYDDLVEDHTLIRHYMEANFIQDMHLKALEPLAREIGRPLRITGDTRGKGDKFTRISSLEPLFTNANIDFDATQKEDPHMLRLIDQLCGFEKGASLNDDGPDALESAIFQADAITLTEQPPVIVSRPRSKFLF